ncbi:GerMN domain-containing protein [Amycolatopsis acidicola]|uniref:GerMN domain-containing protein n=1 Tax=Amycolatopsis acidicola TaxID=2596893 RepID=A0A5N0V134_9PSEU|nr:GerMN domain-containing protein [Amycolatopsis acidicola]KAA9158070.1 GerMN domain-containing protein [Amycolatopsis acidicola]
MGKRVLIALLVLAALTGSGVISGGSPPSGPAVPEVRTLYFVSSTGLVVVKRVDVPADVVTLLAQGPNETERARGLSTQVPASAAPAEIQYSRQGAEVSLGSTDLSQVAIDQIVCTVLVNQGEGASSVTLRAAGRALTNLTCHP